MISSSRPTGSVLSVSSSPTHQIAKVPREAIRLIADFGVEDDAHAGATVQHRSRVAQDPNQPNLRQVHLIPSELFQELAAVGFQIQPGMMGENITTKGIDLLSLCRGTQLHIGEDVIIEVTGLRNPCNQLNGLKEGLMKALVFTDYLGNVIRKAGIMGIVRRGGTIQCGDQIQTILPPGPQLPLERV